MRFYLDSSVQRAGGLLGGIVILATLLSYATANKKRPPEAANKQPASVALAAVPIETADHFDLADGFTERWTAVASEAYRAAVAERSRPVVEPQPRRVADAPTVAAPAAPAPAAAAPTVAAPTAAAPAASPAAQYPMAQATEEDLKQYLDEHRAKAEKNSEQKSRDDICKKGRTYFYRGHHQYWHCRR